MFGNYLKIVIKVLLRRKFFTFISLFGISFTLVVLMVVTAVFDHIFGMQPPEVNQKRTLGVFRVMQYGPGIMISTLAGHELLERHLDIRTLPGIEDVSISTVFLPVTAYHRGEKVSLFRKRTDSEYWNILNFEFLEGGPFTDEDVQDGRFVAVLNESTKGKFFGTGGAVGRTIDVGGQSYKVIGVVKDVPIIRLVAFADMWVPLSTCKDPNYMNDGFTGLYIGLILANSRREFSAIKREFAVRLSQIKSPDPDEWDTIVCVPETVFQSVSRLIFGGGGRSTEDFSGMLLTSIILLMVIFMLLPAINLVNVNLSRIMERCSEIGIRKAFGASSFTLIGQFVLENILLTLLGGMLGFILSGCVLGLINQSGLIPYSNFGLNQRVFAYGLLLILFFGLFSGVYPAWKMSRMHPVEALREGTQ
jgi:putative ABC transport system permease protein